MLALAHCSSKGVGESRGAGTSADTAALSINGNIDGVFANADGSFYVAGWACALTSPQSIPVDLYLGGPAGTGVGISRTEANAGSEPAVAAACQTTGSNFRFQIPLSAALVSQYHGSSIYVHGIDPFGLPNSLLANSGTYTMPTPSITGNIDGIVSNGDGTFSIAGWACALTASQSIDVDLYLGGPAGSGVGISRTLANVASEPAVAAACQGSGSNYRFLIPLSADIASQYRGSPIYVHGIDPYGLPNSLLANSGTYAVEVVAPVNAACINEAASCQIECIAAGDGAQQACNNAATTANEQCLANAQAAFNQCCADDCYVSECQDACDAEEQAAVSACQSALASQSARCTCIHDQWIKQCGADYVVSVDTGCTDKECVTEEGTTGC